MKLESQILLDLKKYKDGVEFCLSVIDNRVNEIYDKIYKLFKVNADGYERITASIKYELFDHSYTDNCEYCHQALGETDINELDAFMSGVQYIPVKTNYHGGLNIIDIDDKILNLASKFPQRWLYDDNFEEELKNGYEKLQKSYEDKRAKYKAKKVASKEEKVKLQELIKSKLSAEELELISFKKK